MNKELREAIKWHNKQLGTPLYRCVLCGHLSKRFGRWWHTYITRCGA
jgi:hypothetical protein